MLPSFSDPFFDVEAIHTDNPAGYEIIKQVQLEHISDPGHTSQFGFLLRRPMRSIKPNIDQVSDI